MTTLEIKDLHVSVANPDAVGEQIPILKGVNLTVKSGETHAVMGPNGSGKSTLSYAIAGHPKYSVTSGSIRSDGWMGGSPSSDLYASASKVVFRPWRRPASRPELSPLPMKDRSRSMA